MPVIAAGTVHAGVSVWTWVLGVVAVLLGAAGVMKWNASRTAVCPSGFDCGPSATQDVRANNPAQSSPTTGNSTTGNTSGNTSGNNGAYVPAGIPAGFPSGVPIYPGATVRDINAEEGVTADVNLVLLTPDSIAVTAAWYRKELDARGWTVYPQDDASPGVVFATKDGIILTTTSMTQVELGIPNAGPGTAISLMVLKGGAF